MQAACGMTTCQGDTWSARSGTKAETVSKIGWPRLTAAGDAARGLQEAPPVMSQKPTDWLPVEIAVQPPVAAH